MSRHRGLAAGWGFSLALACCATACMGPGDPPAGTLPTPGATSTGSTAPTGSPATASPGATGTGGPSGPASATVDPGGYQPATPTSPAKNVPKPVLPEAAKKKDLEGQKAFIKYWISTYNYMRESGDTGPFLAACEKTSKFCSGSVAVARSATKAGIWRVGAEVKVTVVRAQGVGKTGADASVLAALHEPAYSFHPSERAASFAPRNYSQEHSVSIDLRFVNGAWHVLEMGQL